MFFILSKVFNFLFAPVSWIFLFALIAAFSRKPGRRKRFMFVSILLLYFFSNTFLFDRFMQAWEIRAVEEDKIAPCAAGILLTGMATYDPKLRRLEFNDRTDRLMQALRLYKTGKIKKLILCGGPVTIGGTDTLEPQRLKDFLVTLGVSADDLLLETKSRNTHENAVFMKPILQQYFPGKPCLLITSAAHLNRAIACFYKEGMLVIPYSTDRYSGPVKWEPDYLLLPSAATLFNWEKLIHEWVGMIGYWVMGYV
jgi:uncharacterized SAM-binding protein YcdF (DUF218 family)